MLQLLQKKLTLHFSSFCLLQSVYIQKNITFYYFKGFNQCVAFRLT